MRGTDRGVASQIGDGAGHTQHAVIGARRKQQARQGVAQQLIAFFVGGTQPVDFARAEEGVWHSLAVELALVRLEDPLPDRFARFGGAGGHQVGIARRGNFELDVDAVGQRP